MSVNAFRDFSRPVDMYQAYGCSTGTQLQPIQPILSHSPPSFTPHDLEDYQHAHRYSYTIFDLSGCSDPKCLVNPLRSSLKEMVSSIVFEIQKDEITIISYGAGGLKEDFSLLAKLNKICVENNIRKRIKYIIVDPIYADQTPTQSRDKRILDTITAFYFICSKSLKNISVEVWAYKDVESVEKSIMADVIIDCDTPLFTSCDNDFEKLQAHLLETGHFFSLTDAVPDKLNLYEIKNMPTFNTRGVLLHLQKSNLEIQYISHKCLT